MRCSRATTRHHQRKLEALVGAGDRREEPRAVETGVGQELGQFGVGVGLMALGVTVEAAGGGVDDPVDGDLGARVLVPRPLLQPEVRAVGEDGVLGDRISLVEKITPKMRKAADGTDNAEFSIGGMASKLNAAKIVNSAGEYLWIADGRKDDTLERILKGDEIGTLFMPAATKMQARERWLHFFAKSKGNLVVDDGAAKALCHQGRSLLPAGVKEVSGRFKRGDTLEIVDSSGKIIARGLSNFDSAEATQIAGKQSCEISQILRRESDDVIVHRNNLTVVPSENI